MFVSNLQPKFANRLIEMLHDIWWDLDSHALVLPNRGEWNAATATNDDFTFLNWTNNVQFSKNSEIDVDVFLQFSRATVSLLFTGPALELTDCSEPSI